MKSKAVNFAVILMGISLLQFSTQSTPLTDLSKTIIGKVFHDINRNGIQDQNEYGIPGVRLNSVTGLEVETDAYGRYHIDSIESGKLAVFTQPHNFILKLDKASLPQGAMVITENPRVIRLGQQALNKINFGVVIY